jgi:hypothetical protein
VEQDHEEDLKEEEVDEESNEEEDKKEEENEKQYIQVPPKTTNKQVQENHPSKTIIGNKDAGVETTIRIHSAEQQHVTSLTINPLSR